MCSSYYFAVEVIHIRTFEDLLRVICVYDYVYIQVHSLP